MSFVKRAGSKLIATRLRQLSAHFWDNRNQTYTENNIKFKPNWGVVIMVIQVYPNSSLNDIANELGFAHTSVLKIVKDMTSAGYIKAIRDKNDSRRKILSLTAEGKKEHQKNEYLKDCIEKVNLDLIKDTGILEAIEKIETRLEEYTYYERLKMEIAHQTKMVPFENTKHAKHFKALNQQWIESYFKLEKNDLAILDGPVKHIIEKKGEIIMAERGDHVLGTVALLPHNTSELELCRMAVYPKNQGEGIGTKLIKEAILFARNQAYKTITLYSNTQLKPALHLYQKFGFTEVSLEEKAYKRANIKMMLVL